MFKYSGRLAAIVLILAAASCFLTAVLDGIVYFGSLDGKLYAVSTAPED